MKRNKIVLSCALLLLVVALCLPAFAANTPYRVAMVTDIGGLGDKSFNDAAYDGLKMLQSKFGAEIKVVESKKMEDYVPNLKSLADQKFDMIWAIGFLMADATKEVAKMYPDQKFGIVDDASFSLPNVVNVTFKEQEGSFLVGLIAAKDSKKNKVGFVGGMEFPLIQKFEAGYKAGVKAANPKAKIYTAYVGAFDNPAKGKELAQAQFAYGADIVYHAAGASGLGVIDAAKERGKGFWAIGVDKCQHESGVYKSGNKELNSVLACMVKRVDIGVFKATSDAMNGKFAGGKQIELGLAEDGVGVCPAAAKTASKAAMALVEKYKKLIISGKIVVPTDPKAVK